MLKRTMDATRLNEVANHPDVRPYLGGAEGALDLWGIARNPENFLLEAEHGGFFLRPLEHGVYELHTLFEPLGRGKKMFAAAREMLRYMFTRTDALEIVTKCPDDNPAARMAALKVGFRERFRRENCWGPKGDVGASYQAITIDGWAMRDEEALKRGELFHLTLEAAKIRAGSPMPTHPQDEAHDRAAGAALLIIGTGQDVKGVGYYNRFANVSGYAQVALVGLCTVDVRDAVVTVEGERVGVLLVR